MKISLKLNRVYLVSLLTLLGISACSMVLYEKTDIILIEHCSSVPMCSEGRERLKKHCQQDKQGSVVTETQRKSRVEVICRLPVNNS